MLLNKDNLKNHISRRSKVVKFDGFEVKIIQASLKQQLEIEEINVNKKVIGDLVTPVLARCCVDDENNPLFTEDEANELPTDIALKLFEECLSFNNLEKTDFEEVSKNS